MNLLQSLITIFLIITIGYICGKKQIFNDSQIEGFEIFLFKIAIPLYLFSSILSHHFHNLINLPYIYGYILCFASIAVLVGLYFIKKESRSDVYIKILCAGYVNAAIYTLPIITFLLGDPKAAILGNLIQVIIFQSLFLVLLSFVENKEQTLEKKLLKALSSPMIVLPIIGMILSYFQVILPQYIVSPIQSLGNNASGLALFVFGLTMSHIKIKKDYFNKDFMFVILNKNILHPVFAFFFGRYLFHLEGYWLYSLIIAASAPTAFIVYLIAKQFRGDVNFVKMTVASTSIVSLFSIIVISILFSS